MLFLVAGIWELIRFVAVFLSSVAAPAAVANAHVNLLWLATPALVIAALFFSSSYHPDHLRVHLPILRIGAFITVISDLAVVLTGSYDWTAAAPTAIGPMVLFILAFGVLVVDLLVVAYLLAYRLPVNPTGRTPAKRPPVRNEDLPHYDPTDLDGKLDDR